MKKLLSIISILIAILLLGNFKNSQAQDEAPVFAGQPVYPNVFFIFDTSESMNEVPYRNQYGAAYKVSWWRWKYAIKTDENGNPLYTGDGFQRIPIPNEKMTLTLILTSPGEIIRKANYFRLK